MRQKLDATMTAIMAWVAAFSDELQYRAGMLNTLIDIQSEKLAADSKAQGGTVEQIVVVGATLLIGIIVMSQIVESMPAIGNNSAFNGTMDRVEGILDSSFLLAAILPLVIVAGAVLFYVSRFGDNGR